MVKAIPINKIGIQIGKPVNFSDSQFERMKKTFGKNLRWKLYEKKEEEKVIILKSKKQTKNK